jgi:hypothetical protein
MCKSKSIDIDLTFTFQLQIPKNVNLMFREVNFIDRTSIKYLMDIPASICHRFHPNALLSKYLYRKGFPS